jgi:chloramphenicol O-acetyltransferase type B
VSVYDRVIWFIKTRPRLKKVKSTAHWLAFVDTKSVIVGNNKFGSRSIIIDSFLGQNTYVAGATICLAHIGAFCSVGPLVNIGGLGTHPTRWLSTHPSFYSTRGQSGAIYAKKDLYSELAKTTIGNDIWIGAKALILDGVEIGDGAIIAAGSVITKNIPPYAIVGGVPAKLIRYRFSDDVIQRLIRWKWWELSDYVLAKLADNFCNTEDWTVELIEQLEECAALLLRERGNL